MYVELEISSVSNGEDSRVGIFSHFCHFIRQKQYFSPVSYETLEDAIGKTGT